ncbi:MAG TPA: SUMF1/EgtB/PvdO family nonheme iron enzyme [Pyrinomonadaceae bacterium]
MNIPKTLLQKRYLIISIVIGVGVFATGVFFLMRRSGAGKDQTASVTTPQLPPGMVYVPGGEFMMGRDDASEYERPAHKVMVKPFFIDIYEVTNEEWKACFMAGQCRGVIPQGWVVDEDHKTISYPVGTGRQPVTGVGFNNAEDYAKWAGKRLPTEQEWEFAARGTDGRRYPWGNDWSAGLANADGASDRLADVGTHKGASPFGAFDMGGNASEWTDSLMYPYIGGHWITVKVTLDSERLRVYNVTVEGVAAAFRAQNMEVQSVQVDGRSPILIVFVKSIADPTTLNGLAVAARSNSQITVHDVGYIEQEISGRVVRGGSYLSTREQATTTFRRNFATSREEEGLRNIGFRCVKDAER